MAESSAAHRSVSREFTALSFVWRFAASLALVLITYNPAGYSYFHWVRRAFGDGGLGPEHLLAGAVLAVGWTVLIVATKRSLETLGTVLGIVLLGALVWLFIDLGWLRVNSMSALSWVVLVCIAALLAIGLCWSHIWRRLTGQFEVDEDG